MGQSELDDPAQSLKPGMFNDIENKVAGYRDQSVNGIIDNFSFVGQVVHRRIPCNFVKR
jgi:predicted  nucleic acid-binding Zn ribbon protein